MQEMDTDGELSEGSVSLCKICLTACLVLAFGQEALALL
jgi:hypothetical protein